MTPRGWLLPALLLAAAGAAQTPAFVHTTWLWPLPLAGAALLAAQCRHAPPGRAALCGWAYGCGWLVAATGWLYISLHRYGGLAAPLAAAAVLALAAVLSLYLAAACWLCARWRRGHWAADAALFACVWLAAELARGVLFTGFPWAASGYAMVDGPLAPLAPWVGVYGIGALLALVAALVAARRPLPVASGLLLLGAAALAGPAQFGAGAGSFTVALLQNNVAQDEKFVLDELPASLAWTAAALRDARADLVVTPETAVPLVPAQLEEFAPGYWPALAGIFAAPDRAALVGVPLGDDVHGYTNSVVGLPGLPGFYRYDKLHLVPFGEFIPPGFRWFTDALSIPLGDFARGVRNPPSFAAAGQRLAPNICYEDLFGEELALRFGDPARAPTVFVNVSNIGWFGDSWAIPQHLNISRLRTLEFQRPMLRATNTGATAVVDHRGRVTAALPPLTRGVLTATVEGRNGTTPYAWWTARAGLAPLWLIALGGALMIGVVGTRRGRR